LHRFSDIIQLFDLKNVQKLFRYWGGAFFLFFLRNFKILIKKTKVLKTKMPISKYYLKYEEKIKSNFVNFEI
jgi:hypothetical protein